MRLQVNGNQRAVDARPGATLLGVLRDDLGLTGTRYGCGRGVCGACYVLVDGQAAPACTLSLDDVAGREIITVEGLEQDGVLHRVQRAFLEEDAMQCGYCTSGMVISAVALLARSPQPTDEEIRDALTPNLCRCGVYLRAIRAVQRATR